MNILKRLRGLVQSKNRKKIIENTVIVAIIGIIAIIAGSTFLSGGKKPPQPEAGSPGTAEVATAYSGNTGDTETKLKNILSQVEGAGKVDVMVTYISGKENIPAYDTKESDNTTDEKDSGGGTRKIAQSSNDSAIVFKNGANGEKSPVIIKELEPAVKGVLVVAEGASDPQVREKLARSVQVLLDIPLHKIQVIERKK